VAAAKAQGYRFPWLLYYVLLPLIYIPALSAILAGFLISIFHGNVNETPRGIALGLLVFFYALLFWFAYIFPRGDYCVLHERGIRIRVWLKRRILPFSLIASFNVGRVPSKAEIIHRKFTRVLNPEMLPWMEELDGTALTILTTDGKIHVFRTFFTRFNFADLQTLFDEWIRLNPHLVADDDAPNLIK